MSNSISYNLNEVMQAAIDYNLGNLYTCLPGVVQSFNPSKGTVDVKPSIKKLMSDGKTMDLPVLKEVPIVMPQCSQGGLSLPIGSGDGVLLMFSQRSIDAWKAGKTDSKPNSTRKFSISDAFAIPGSIPATQRSQFKKTYSAAPVLSGSKLFIGNPNAPKVGTTQMVNVDVVAILVQVLDLLTKLFPTNSTECPILYVPPSGTPTPVTYVGVAASIANFPAYKSALSSLVYSPS